MKKLKSLFLILCLFIPFCFAGCENQNKNSLSTPNIVNIVSGTIVFDQVPNAEYYTISINDDEYLLDAKYNNNVTIVDNLINYKSNYFTEGNSYSVKIKAHASNKNDSAYSEAYSYKHLGDIVKPTNVRINGTTLTWDAAKNATSYLVKVVTPSDTVIYDKNGDMLLNIDAETIANANLPEYTFKDNSFPFASLLKNAGKYYFYVNTVHSDGGTIVNSGYTPISVDTTYTHKVQLATPVVDNIVKRNDGLYLTTVVDTNANAISLSCGDVEETFELLNINTPLNNGKIIANNNLLNINLNKFFSGKNIDFNAITQLSFKIKVKNLTTNPDHKYYLDSNYTENIIYENTKQISSPEIAVNYDSQNQCYIASWIDNDLLASSYTLYLFTATGVKEKSNINNTSYMITEDFIAVAVKAEGYGNYISSPLSNIASHPNLTETLTDPTFEVLAGNNLVWNSIDGAYYVVEFNNRISVTNNPNYLIDTDYITTNRYNIYVTTVKEGFCVNTATANLKYEPQLSTPTGLSFSGENLYQLSFNPVENAIGYYVYIKTNSIAEYSKIDKLFTSTSIDLSSYITSIEYYGDYQVVVQAVANPNTFYQNSGLSIPTTVSHATTLAKPQFASTHITEKRVGGRIEYYLNFYGVAGAESYEVLINYNRLEPVRHLGTTLHSVNVTSWLQAATDYEIKVRALPNESALHVNPSDWSIVPYSLYLQLDMVDNIQVKEQDGVFTLSFNTVSNAESYNIRVVKVGDNNYINYLNSLGLQHNFIVKTSADISQYVQQQGVYYFYVTALASENSDGNYVNSPESETYAVYEKVTSLASPTNINFSNVDKNTYTISWTGDDNADYYLIKLTDPNKFVYDFNVYDETSANINKYITIQGEYSVAVYSMSNSTEFMSSAKSTAKLNYLYREEQDFYRYSIYMYGESYDFTVSNIQDLKMLLWYNYLYPIDYNGLRFILNRQTGETVQAAILRLANESHKSKLYEFNDDADWLSLVSGTNLNINAMMAYMSEKILGLYPEMNILANNVSVESNLGANSNTIFRLSYLNQLAPTKDIESNLVLTNTDYGNEFEYIPYYARKSSTALFKIDEKQEMLVSTSEQLLQAVQHNRKPKFYGDSASAQEIYANAKYVLSAIISNNMTDLEKVTAIFDWLSYGFNLNHYSNKEFSGGLFIDTDLDVYGYRNQYYLEGIFSNSVLYIDGADIMILKPYATAQSYSKAFALLCGIEGISATVVNGSYSYFNTPTQSYKTVDHVWNKVLISLAPDQDKAWYAVDLTFSDNRIWFNNLNSGYAMSSHTNFLVSDDMLAANLNSVYGDVTHNFILTDDTWLISSNYADARTSSTSYDYYKNSSFSKSSTEISQLLKTVNASSIKGFTYAKEFSKDTTYQTYPSTQGYGPMQSFLFNYLLDVYTNLQNNASGRTRFEFRFSWDDNDGSNIFKSNDLSTAITGVNQYGLKITNKDDSKGNGSIFAIYNETLRMTTIVVIAETKV